MARSGGEGVGEVRRDDDEVSAFGGDDPVSRQELGGAVEQVEQLGGAGVVVRPGAVGAAAERDALGGQGTAGGAASASRQMVVGARPTTSASPSGRSRTR